MQNIDIEMFKTEELLSKQIKYEVIYEEDQSIYAAIRNLNNKINEYLQKGWLLQGGVCIIEEHGPTWYLASQAMIKITPKKDIYS